jgi:hypothetical protein
MIVRNNFIVESKHYTIWSLDNIYSNYSKEENVEPDKQIWIWKGAKEKTGAYVWIRNKKPP